MTRNLIYLCLFFVIFQEVICVAYEKYNILKHLDPENFTLTAEIIYDKIKSNELANVSMYHSVALKIASYKLNKDFNKLSTQLLNSMVPSYETAVLDNCLSRIVMNIASIESHFLRFAERELKFSAVENCESMNFLKNTINFYRDEIDYNLEELYTSLIPNIINGDRAALQFIHKYLQQNTVSCSTTDQFKDILRDMYRIIYMIEVEVYIMMKNAAHTHSNVLNWGKIKNYLESSHNKTITAFETYVEQEIRKILACGPRRDLEDVAFVRLDGVFSKHIVKKSPEQSETCNISSIINNRLDWWKKCPTCSTIFYPRFECPGKYIRDCKSYDIAVCPVNTGSITDSNFVSLKKATECNNPTTVDARSNCICICDRHRVELSPIEWNAETKSASTRIMKFQETDGFFDLNPTFSDVDNYYVVTGARLRKKNHVIYIEIQQGQLTESGEIDENTVRWVVNNNISDPYSVKKELSSVNNVFNYHVLEWNGKRRVNLFTQEVDKHEFVTGLSFTLINYQLTILVYKSLIVNRIYPIKPNEKNIEEPYYLYKNGKKGPYTNNSYEIDIEELDLPTRCSNVKINSDLNSYVQFTTSGIRNDVGQTTVPFIDIQEVTTKPPKPIRGAGLHYKSSIGCAGFLGLHLLESNYRIKYEPKFM